MFLSLRDLRFARGRFALIGSVVAMITLLVVMLTGLTDGLGRQSTSALEALDAPRIVLDAGDDGEDPTYSDSRIDAQQAGSWAGADGVVSKKLAAPDLVDSLVRLAKGEKVVSQQGQTDAGEADDLASSNPGKGRNWPGRDAGSRWPSSEAM